ncbi:Yip1 domain protein [compost metagenome]
MKELFTIFTSPESTFQRLKSNKLAWLICMIVLMVVSLPLAYLQMPILEQTMLEGLKSNAQISPDTYDSLIAGTKLVTYVTSFITPAITIFVGGLLLMLLNLIVRGEGKYMQLVTIVAYAYLPGLIGGILTAILLNVTDAKSLMDVTISLGALIQDKESMLFKVLSVINPFSIWSMILYIIGSSVIMNRPKKQIAIWIVVVWVLFSFVPLLLV